MVGHRGDLHDIGVEGRHPSMEVSQIGGRANHVVMADDPLCRTIPADRTGHIIFQVHVVGPLDDRHAEQL